MPVGEAIAETAVIYCNGARLQEITEITLPELSDRDKEHLRAINSPFSCSGTIQIMEMELNSLLGGLPIEQRYIVHCMNKGWNPSLRGLKGFIRMSQLGFYKTL